MADDVLIIGCGASGMAAAIKAAETGAAVRVFEKKEQPGKKLLTTGNGKCNYSNFYLTERNYRGHDHSFVNDVIHKVHTEDLLTFFESIGMLSTSRDKGLYPSTERAETVVRTLRRRMEEYHVTIEKNCNIVSAESTPDGFTVTSDDGKRFFGRTLIVAAGSPASVSDPRPFSGYDVAASFGHHVYRVLPALTKLKGSETIEPIWSGVRLHAGITYRQETASGEIQFTEDGISGIPVFQISRFVIESLCENRSGRENVFLNLLPGYDMDALVTFLSEASRRSPDLPLHEYLTGWLPKKLVAAVVRRYGDAWKRPLQSYDERAFQKIASILTSFPYTVTGHGAITESQAAQGGVDTSEVSSTLESKLVPGLFFTGEILDIDGECGGYNLHFAFASGLIAGENAGRDAVSGSTL